MASERRLRAVSPADDPIWRLWEQLPPQWRGPVIGDGIDNWPALSERGQKLDLTGLPSIIAAEMAWMAHWQAHDGTLVLTQQLSQFGNILRLAMREGHPFPPLIRETPWEIASALQGWYYAHRHRRLPPPNSRAVLQHLFGFSRLALLARCHEGQWWQLDEWSPRCDPRIPLASREPTGSGCSPSQITLPWLRSAAKWQLGTTLESGSLRWVTVKTRLSSLRRFDAWLTTCLDDPGQIFTDPVEAGRWAAAFARWAADPRNRVVFERHRRLLSKPVSPSTINTDINAVAELLEFIADNPVDARAVLGTGPWQQVTTTHAALWFRQAGPVRKRRKLNDEHYVDDHALTGLRPSPTSGVGGGGGSVAGSGRGA